MYTLGCQSQNGNGAAVHLSQHKAIVITNVESLVMGGIEPHLAECPGEREQLRTDFYSETLTPLKAERFKRLRCCRADPADLLCPTEKRETTARQDRAVAGRDMAEKGFEGRG
ncbi:hypothetical protein GRO01_13790 [Gluconobacter roseus NBRC 3990]|uniref:Uncharacterized protein n=1 Tax=Gluconobacter roseus NBRC 3990 TaxID=1307950 RepID=A0A4Y3M5C5_9PROT|nr:hypothetical protein AA3990_0269 [Gluconobacter roseus NBRC 3990]GEB03803.1 hypothetical protein GRO01_13790 [Gluconobacter roseus NBRC 3990]GLP94257.1 hypothetical protein GCM10007871_22350 [Gluconobacter roseus NBRC 3990]